MRGIPSRSDGEAPELRCLLMSPVAPPESRNGDAQYTEDLVEYPPDGVEYVRYTDALASGELEWGPSIRDRKTWGAPAALPAAATRAGVSVARKLGLLLPDPVCWIRVRGRFDVVHIHCMPIRFLGPRPPVLLTDSAGTFWYWTAARGVPSQRVTRLLKRERVVARGVHYLHPTVNPAAERLLFFIESGVRLAEEIGVDASDAIICGPGVPAASRTSRGDGRTLLFVARSFAHKGGPDALEVLELVRMRMPEVRLLVAGPDEPESVPAGVEWLGPMRREQLYDEVYPRADLFLYPTRFDCAPLVVQEALAHGLPIVAPRTMGLPDLVRHNETGYLFEPWHVDEAAAAVCALLNDPAKLSRMGVAALADFGRRFSVGHRNQVLGSVYRSMSGCPSN